MFSLLISCIERKNRNAALQEREILSDSEIYTRYFSGSDVDFPLFQSVWLKIETTMHVESGKLRPDDDLETLVGLPSWLAGSQDIGDLEDDLYFLEAKQRLRKRDDTVLNTIGEVVYAFAKAMVK